MMSILRKGSFKVRWLGVGASLMLACGVPPADPDDDDDPTTATSTTSTTTPPPPPDTDSNTDTGQPSGSTAPDPMTSTSGTTAADSSSTGIDTSPPLFDLGELPDVTKVDEACGAVDFLFVIDNSGSMSDEQANLVASFPGFIAAIQGTLDQVEEYNIGVTTSDAYSPNLAVPGCNVLGGLVVQTGGSNSSNMQCGPYDAGNTFMTEVDDLDVAFACAGQVGTSGNPTELMMSALLEAVDVSGPLAQPGGCNEGFIREDALLVLVIITDEYDGPGDPEFGPSPGTPADWYDAVVAAKDGIAENVVVVTLVNAAGGPCPPASMVFDGVNMVDFTMMFGDNGLVGGVCEPDYSPVFADAVSVIDVACDNFMPPN